MKPFGASSSSLLLSDNISIGVIIRLIKENGGGFV